MPPFFHLVIPAFNERARLPASLEDLCEEISRSGSSSAISVEVVDDGSTPAEAEAMAAAVEALRPRFPFLLPIRRLESNVGKGGTIYAGWDAAPAGAGLLGFVDADGAVPAAEVVRVVRRATAEPGAATFAVRDASRAGTVERTPLRDLMGRLFAGLVHLLFRFPFHDTQCGFKIVPAGAYRGIRPVLKVTGFDFDIELAYRLLEAGVEIRTEPVRWHETPGSKVSALAAASMFFTLVALRVSLHRSPHPSGQRA